MVTKWLKRGLILGVAACVVLAFLFGTDLLSYAKSSAKSVRSAVKSTVPIEFELKRARDKLEDVIPEMHANVRLIAQEEVEIANLKTDINDSQEYMADAGRQIKKLRQSLDMQYADYTFGGHTFSRDQVKDDLGRRFEQFKEAEIVLEGKKRLLAAREKSLYAAMQLLERTKSQKRILEDKIEGLTSRFHLLKASAVGSTVQIDGSKLAQTEKLIGDIKKRLDVAERVLAHENRLQLSIPVDTVDEKDLLEQIDDYFQPSQQDNEAAKAADTDEVCRAEDSL